MLPFENRMPLPPKMKLVQSTQPLRKSALDWQLIALEAQTEALLQIAAEHHVHITDIDPRSLYNRTRDLVNSAHDIEKMAGTRSMPETLNAIRALRNTVNGLTADADSFVERAEWRAQFRMSQNLHLLIDIDGAKSDSEPMTTDAHRLVANASKRCLQAECQQDETFALQIKSICNLALELVFIAAADHSPKNI